ncbi:hypothetical protein U9M48_002091 [Paspalum notatum var. saurae]|uniref:Uncharacterized protein n=1 Tax=Paspalum notatum var. saurae TaxID=547442 RepID=A0AAQ3PQN9_PASNO
MCATHPFAVAAIPSPLLRSQPIVVSPPLSVYNAIGSQCGAMPLSANPNLDDVSIDLDKLEASTSGSLNNQNQWHGYPDHVTNGQ